MSAQVLLDRLQGVRHTARDRWIARCPSHDDRSPSLSVRELEDGRTLIKCFAGCGAIDVLSAVGLEWAALFPEKLNHAAPSRSCIPARDLLEIISEETSIVSIVAADILARCEICEADWKRLAIAAARISRARDHAYGR